MRRLAVLASLLLLLIGGTPVRAGDVSGRVAMPDVCSPGVSPAVVSLEPVSGSRPARAKANVADAEVVLVDQKGLQFVPRVQAMSLGRTLRFTNADSERHSVHVVTPGFDFNQSMAPGEPHDWVPDKPGVVRLACDIHSHMRGYVVVSDSPWVAVCSRDGKFRFSDVPEGRYVVNVWHEMGEPLRKEIEIGGGATSDLGTLTVTAPSLTPVAGQVAPVLPWSEVIDRISLTLAASFDAATRPGEFKKARRLAEDAYWGEFEGSDMEIAVRSYLGYARAKELEGEFYAIADEASKVAKGEKPPEAMAELTRKLLLNLVSVSDALNKKGITDRAHVFVGGADSRLPPLAATVPGARDQRGLLLGLKRGLHQLQTLADKDEPDDAASAMTSVYLVDFEPLERILNSLNPREVRPLEIEFNRIRGEVGAGLKGEKLAVKLDDLQERVALALGRVEGQPAGTFGPAFAGSLFIMLREGVEVILLLAMLVALATKTAQPGAMRAIGWGVGLAVVASIITAVGLNLIVSSAQNKTREVAEGVVMLAAAGVLFYVSYWLISQSESKRWMDFLKRQAARGSEIGGLSTLALTAFLAVYREGAETALMYQALLGGHGKSREGLMGLAVGLGVGLVLLAVIALIIRASSVRLPLRSFFKVSGMILFAMAVVFAGNGIFELQNAGILKTTELEWFGPGLPALGLHPNVQALSVQGLLLLGAGFALLLVLTGDVSSAPKPAPRPATSR
ncbi:FTR1 family protein [Singulisphaera sp. GP187]|uniref:FTR1 family protein n=1 Tax=Singulisphaera sp. GP187 TaxID=1882752 RepID=UPI0009414D07|nr:FTR1 family protein [Singulisphaera sp. GP187]